MCKQISVSQLRAKVQEKINKIEQTKESLKGSDNPQILSLCTELEGRQTALKAVLSALCGNMCILDCF